MADAVGTPAISDGTGGGGTASVLLPDDIASGELIGVAIAGQAPGCAMAFGFPGGWAETYDMEFNCEHAQCFAWLVADGSEGGTSISVSLAESKPWAAVAFRVSGHNSSTNAPESAGSSAANIGSASEDPPALNPAAWGTEETLWLVISATNENRTISSFPTNFTEVDTSSRVDASIAVCSQVLEAESMDPDSITWNTTADPTAFTVGIQTGSEGASGTVAELSATVTATATTSASVDTLATKEVAASAAGVGSVVATLYKIKQVSGGAVSGVATVTAQIVVESATEFTATSAGVGSASASMSVVRAASATSAGVADASASVSVQRSVAATSDGQASTTVSITSSHAEDVTATANGQASAVAAIAVVRSITATADGQAVATVDVQAITEDLSLSAQGQATVTLELFRTANRSASPQGVTAVAVEVNLVRARVATAAGQGAATASMQAIRSMTAAAAGAATVVTSSTTNAVDLEPPFTAEWVDPARTAVWS